MHPSMYSSYDPGYMSLTPCSLALSPPHQCVGGGLLRVQGVVREGLQSYEQSLDQNEGDIGEWAGLVGGVSGKKRMQLRGMSHSELWHHVTVCAYVCVCNYYQGRWQCRR